MKHIMITTFFLSILFSQIVESEDNIVYIARIFNINENNEQTLNQLEKLVMPVWNQLVEDEYLITQQLFETNEIYPKETEFKNWNYLLLSKIPRSISANDFFKKESILLGNDSLFQQIGFELLRSEILMPTPNSYYPNPIEESSNSDLEIEYWIEYIAVNNDKESLDEYRTMMEQYFGLGAGLSVNEGKLYCFIALETTDVHFTNNKVPDWNQIHIMGILPNVEESPNLDSVMKAKGIDREQMMSIVSRVYSIRTKPREDSSFELKRFRIGN